MVLLLLSIAFSLALIALAAGLGLNLFGRNSLGVGVKMARFFGIFITFFAVLSLFITTYLAINFITGFGSPHPVRGPAPMGPVMQPGQKNMMPGQPMPGMKTNNGSQPGSQRMRSIPSNEKDMQRQDRPGPPEKVMSPQSKLYPERHQKQVRNYIKQEQAPKSMLDVKPSLQQIMERITD